MNREKLIGELIRDEAEELNVYRDSRGHWTIGIGHFVDRKEVEHPRILRITAAESRAFLEYDIDQATKRVLFLFTPLVFEQLSDARQRVLVNMSFNLGGRLSGFVKFISAVKKGNWVQAGLEMEDSDWWKQVKDRAPRLRKMMEEG